jgi:hypothetical protein
MHHRIRSKVKGNQRTRRSTGVWLPAGSEMHAGLSHTRLTWSLGVKSRNDVTRKSVPEATRNLVLMEAGYKCANPICRHILTLELHHIVWVKDGGENTADNLLALCPNCHSLHTARHIPELAIRTWKQLLVSLNDASRVTADLLLVLYHEERRIESAEDPTTVPPPFRFTGDGLPALSGLITSGIIEISKRYLGAGMFGASMPSFNVKLTDKGKQFVQAWLEGDPRQVELALTPKNA